MNYREPDPESPHPPVRPWTLTLEVVHLGGPAFDLNQHGETVAADIAGRLADIVIDLPGGTRIRIETYMDTTDTTVEAHP